MENKKIMLGVFLTGLGVLVTILFVYVFTFKTLGNDRKVDLLTLEQLSPIPFRKQVTLRFNKGWQLRSEVLNETPNRDNDFIKIKVRNNDSKPMVVALSLDPNSPVFFNCENCEGFIDVLQPMEEKIIYNGSIDDFVGKITRISNKSFLKTSFDISFETNKKIKLQNPIKLFAYEPSGTL